MSHRIPFSLLHLQVTQNQIVPAAAPARAAAPPIPVTTTPAPVTTPTPATKPAKQLGKGEKRQAAPSTTAAVTPKKKKKSKQEVLQSLKPGQLSPFRMDNGNKSRGCDHTNPYGFVPLSRKYFAESYVGNKKYYPKNCCGEGCGLNFVKVADQKKAFNGGDIHACPNAINHRDHECIHALCVGCWIKAGEAAAANSPSKGRIRRTRGATKSV